MSEETKTVVENGAQTVSGSQVQEQEITSEKIAELRNSRDSKGIREAIEKANKLDSTKEPEVVASVGSTTEPTKEVKIEPKKFKDKFRGKEFEIDDDDGFLGYKSLDNLKKENAHKRLYVTEVEEAKRQAEIRAQQVANELEVLRNKYAEVEKQLSTPKKQDAPTVVTPAPVATEVQDAPKPPSKPNKKYDPLDEDSVNEWHKYFVDRDEYNQKIIDNISKYKPDSVRVELPQDVKSEIDNLKNEVNEYKQHFSTIKYQEEQKKVQEALEKTWNAREEFQKVHDEFATKKPLKTIDAEMLSWSDRLAALNGAKMPSKQYDPNDTEWKNYEAIRGSLMDRYINGDKAVVESAGSFTPPDEYDKYLKVMNLELKKNQMIQEGILGNKATLEDVFFKELVSSGKLNESMEQFQKENILRGAKGVTQALRDIKTEYATTLPPDVGGRSSSEAMADISNLSQADIEEIKNYTVDELRRSPEKMKKRTMLLSALAATQ